MLLGDLNGHSVMFNRDLENVGSRRGLDTQRGEKIEDLIAERDMVCLNDGSPARIDKGTGKESTPDVIVVHSSMADRFEWRIEDDRVKLRSQAPSLRPWQTAAIK